MKKFRVTISSKEFATITKENNEKELISYLENMMDSYGIPLVGIEVIEFDAPDKLRISWTEIK